MQNEEVSIIRERIIAEAIKYLNKHGLSLASNNQEQARKKYHSRLQEKIKTKRVRCHAE